MHVPAITPEEAKQLRTTVTLLKAQISLLYRDMDEMRAKLRKELVDEHNELVKEVSHMCRVSAQQRDDHAARISALEDHLFPGIRDGVKEVRNILGDDLDAGFKLDYRRHPPKKD